MSQKFQVNQIVKWAWGSGEARGKIREVYKQKVTKKLKGNHVTRNGTSREPAYLIEQQSGGRVLKSESEIEDA